jgi:uncharacterized protein YbjT (DUF2867 family)
MQNETGRTPVLVTGGTGTLGRLVVARLVAAGCDVRVLSRHPQETADAVEFAVGDLATGEGVREAVAGVATVVHCAGSPRGDEVKARNLVRELVRSPAPAHLVNISVVGADRVPVRRRLDRLMYGYFESKAAAEQVVAGSGLPWTTLRATQFHDFVWTVAGQLARLPVVPSFAGVRFQPIDTGEVADRLVELALDRPAGLVPEMGGPRIYPMTDLIQDVLRVTGRRRLVVPVRQPGAAARAFRAGANLAPQHAVGRRTWEEFLAARTATGKKEASPVPVP